jgi:hypothetical protein
MPPLLGTEPVELQYSGYERVILERESFVFYRAIEECGEMLQLRTWADVETHAAKWLTASDAAAAALPIGYLLSLEGADSILSWRHLEKSRADGLIALGPVHYGPGIHGSGSASSSMHVCKHTRLSRRQNWQQARPRRHARELRQRTSTVAIG